MRSKGIVMNLFRPTACDDGWDSLKRVEMCLSVSSHVCVNAETLQDEQFISDKQAADPVDTHVSVSAI